MKIENHKITPSVIDEFLKQNLEKIKSLAEESGTTLFEFIITLSDDLELGIEPSDFGKFSDPDTNKVHVQVLPYSEISIYAKSYLVMFEKSKINSEYVLTGYKVGTLLRSVQRLYSYKQLRDKNLFEWDS